jgi:glycerophosphoryl diester phosphodiesterase
MIYVLIALMALLLSAGIYIYINPGPNVKQSDRTAWLAKIPIAHRGLHDEEAPENSMEAFRRAIARGYGIEIDVLLSADGKVVVFHDTSLQRMTGVDKGINTLSWEQISQLRLLGTDEGIPLFTELLDLIQGKVPLLIEIKNEDAVGKLEEAVIRDLQGYTGDYAIQAFNPFTLQHVKKHAPHITRGQLSGSFKGHPMAYYKKFLLRFLLLNNLSSPAFIAYQTGALPRWFANRLRKKGLYLLTWTVEDLKGYDEAMKLFDNVIFEGFLAPKSDA